MTWREGSFVPLDQAMVNLSQVRKFEHLDGKQVRVTWANGDEEEMHDDGYSRLLTEPFFIVPAAPGFELLSFWPDPAEGQFERSPVVAWRMDEDQTNEHFGDRSLIGIGLSSTSADEASNMRVAVLRPDGVVTHHRDGQTWESVELWLLWAGQDYLAAQGQKSEAAA
jgi:hypothetical protein